MGDCMINNRLFGIHLPRRRKCRISLKSEIIFEVKYTFEVNENRVHCSSMRLCPRYNNT